MSKRQILMWTLEVGTLQMDSTSPELQNQTEDLEGDQAVLWVFLVRHLESAVSNPEGLRCCLWCVLVHLGSRASLLPLGAVVLGSPFLVSNMEDFQQSTVSSNVTSNKTKGRGVFPSIFWESWSGPRQSPLDHPAYLQGFGTRNMAMFPGLSRGLLKAAESSCRVPSSRIASMDGRHSSGSWMCSTSDPTTLWPYSPGLSGQGNFP